MPDEVNATQCQSVQQSRHIGAHQFQGILTSPGRRPRQEE
jgi:hypothetical protein